MPHERLQYGKLIRKWRKSNDMSQATLSRLVNCNKSYISKIENGVVEPPPYLLELIREKLDMLDVPVTAAEYAEFEQKLDEWYLIIKNKQLDEATERHDRLERAISLSLMEDCELRTRYKLFSAFYWYLEGDIHNIKKLLGELQEERHGFSDEHEYYFNYIMGIYCDTQSDPDSALKYFLAAEAVNKGLNINESGLFYAISCIYSDMDYAYRSIYYAQKALDTSKNYFEKIYIVEIEIILALNYKKIGEYSLALNTLNDCLFQIKNTGDSFMKFLVTHNTACVYTKMKNYKKAFNFFVAASKLCSLKELTYLYNVLYWSYALIECGRTTEALERLEEGIRLTNDGDILRVLFESAKHSLTPGDRDSLCYLEEISVPVLLKAKKHLKAIEYCNLLSSYYSAKRKYKQALRYSSIVNDCYKKILEGDTSKT